MVRIAANRSTRIADETRQRNVRAEQSAGVAYLGRTKPVSVLLNKILQSEVFHDGFSIAREGKENPDFFLLANPNTSCS